MLPPAYSASIDFETKRFQPTAAKNSKVTQQEVVRTSALSIFIHNESASTENICKKLFLDLTWSLLNMKL